MRVSTFLIPNSKYRINEIMSLATDGVSANILLTTNEVTNGQITHKKTKETKLK